MLSLHGSTGVPISNLSCFLTLPLCFFDVCDTDVTSSHHICNRSTLPRHSSNIDSYIILCVNISERKAGQSGRKSVKAGVSMYSTARGHKGTVVHRLDATRILHELRYLYFRPYLYSGPYAAQTN